MRGLRPDLWSKIKMGRDTSQKAKTNTKPKAKTKTTRSSGPDAKLDGHLGSENLEEGGC